MADVEAPLFDPREADHHDWNEVDGRLSEGEEDAGEDEMGSKEEAELSRSLSQNVALDQRIARVLGNLDKVVKDPTRGGVMAGDYGTFMPVQVRGKAVPQRFVRDTGIDIPSLGPPLDPVPPRETPPLVPSALRPKTAAKKLAMPASTLLVNVDPSLAPTKSDGASRSSKPRKTKPSQNGAPLGSKQVASPYKLGSLGASPLGIDYVLASAAPVSPLLNSGPTPSSTASTPERSPGSILRIMTASTLPYGSYVSPIGDLVSWNRMARSSRLGSVQEHEGIAAGAMDASDEERGHDGGRAGVHAKEEARKELWGAERKESLAKKRVKETELGTKPDRAAARADKEPAAAAPASEETSVLDGFLLPQSGVAELESFLPIEKERLPRVGKRQLMQQLSVDQERLKAFLGEGAAAGDLLQRIPHANLKEIERLKKEIERTEAMLRRKLEEDSDSDSSSSSGGGESWGARDRSLGRNAEEQGGGNMSGPARGQSAAKFSDRKGGPGTVKIDGRVDGNAEGRGQETSSKGREERKRQGEVQSPTSKKEKRLRLMEELEEVKRRQAQEDSKGQAKPAGEAAGKDGRTEKRKKDRDTSISMEAGSKDHLGAGDKGSKQGRTPGAVDHPEKLGVREGKGSEEEQSKKKKKMKKKLAGVEVTTTIPHEKVTERDESQDEEGERQRSLARSMKKKKMKQRELPDAVDEKRPKSGAEDKSGKGRLAKEASGTDGAHRSRAVMAAAREALPEADQKRLRAAAANAKLVQQAQMSGDVVELGPRVDLGEDEYVGCDKCDKWRFLPYWLHTKQFTNIRWTCDDVDWLDAAYVGCHVEDKVFEFQTKLINYPPLGGWEKVAEDIKKRGLIPKLPPVVASPTKPKRSAFTQQGDASATLMRTQSADRKKDVRGGPLDGVAGSPLGQRKRLLKEGEARRQKGQAKGRGSGESESGGEEGGAGTKGAKKKLKKRRAVLSDEEESGEEKGGNAGKEQNVRATVDAPPGKGRDEEKAGSVVAAAVEEEDWVVEDEPGREEEALAGGPEEDMGAQHGAKAQPNEAEERERGGREVVRPGAGEERRRETEAKRKLDEEDREQPREKKAKTEAGTRNKEVTEGAKEYRERDREGVEKQQKPEAQKEQREGSEERAFKKKLKKGKRLAETMDGKTLNAPTPPEVSTTAAGDKVKVNDRGDGDRKGEAEGRETKRRKTEGKDEKQGEREKEGGYRIDLSGGLGAPAEAKGEAESKAKGEAESKAKGEAEIQGGTDVTGETVPEVVQTKERGSERGTEPVLKVKGADVDKLEGLSTEGAGRREAGTTGVEKSSEKRHQPEGMGGGRAEETTGTEKRADTQAGVGLVAERKEVTAPAGGEHPFLEEDADADKERKSEAAGAAASLSRLNSLVPRQVQVASRKVVPKDEERGDKGAEKAEPSRSERTATEVEKDGPTSVDVKAAPGELKKEETAPDAKSAASGSRRVAAEARAAPVPPVEKAAVEADVRAPAKAKRAELSDSTSSSDVSSSDVSSDGSELAEEDVVQPAKGGRSARARGRDEPGADPPNPARSTVLQVSPPTRRGPSPLRLGRRAPSEDRDSPPPSRTEWRERDRRDDRDRDRGYRSERRRSPGRRWGERERERSRYYDDRGRGRDYDRDYERDQDRRGGYRRGESPPWRDRRGGSERLEHDRRRDGRDDDRLSAGDRSRSRSLGKEGALTRRDGRGSSRQLSPLPEAGSGKDAAVQKKEVPPAAEKPPSVESRAKGPLARVLPEVGGPGSARSTPPVEMTASTPPHVGGSSSTPAPVVKAASESSRMAGAMAPPPPPAAAGGALDEAHRVFGKRMKEAKDTKHAADKLKEQGQAIAAMVYLDAALKFLLAASSIEVFDAKQASSIYRETAAYLEGLCVGSFSSNQDLAGEALAWQCSAVARTRALQAVKDRALKDRAALHEGLILTAPTGAPGAGPRPPSAGAPATALNPGNAHPGVVGTPPGTIAGSPSSSSASDADAASQAALSLGPHQREPLGHMLHIVHEHFKITACWAQAANLAGQAAKTLGSDALSALNAVGENGGVGSLDSIVQAVRIALDKFGA
ncbi:hypothetical protein KFL_003590140 [Klebsormidium nitens]|uniref:CW-type domain-containing protein n=1 Tax=Klebsormidium nitens TaxID=105231 RepID=A0A1Y1I9C1_KLENI|nr:hypothetical protein KFL_003590140 [Klebsormidium nitens]|eukprot:GAQ87540.1 hypothetical protein KFL_003590140 [Klebsormidium nitens]